MYHTKEGQETGFIPTQRFLKLKEERKQAVLEAAVHEFSRAPYSPASVNQIIKRTDISRGSFYTYFGDKDDLMRYVLRGLKDNCQERVLGTLKEQEGDPSETTLKLLEAMVGKDHGGLGCKMYRNMLSGLNVMNQNHLLGIRGFLLQGESYHEFVQKLCEGTDRERYLADEENLAYLVDMAMITIIGAATLYYKNMVDWEKLLEVLKEEMPILEYSVCRSIGS